jgi:hypothetical protein
MKEHANMSINFATPNANALLNAFKKAIDDKEVVTWAYDEDGDFTHTPEQWKYHAWLRPVVYNGRLTMRFLGHNSEVTTWEVYAVYHGRFVESMVAHCNTLFSAATVPSQPTSDDNITTKIA